MVHPVFPGYVLATVETVPYALPPTALSLPAVITTVFLRWALWFEMCANRRYCEN